MYKTVLKFEKLRIIESRFFPNNILAGKHSEKKLNSLRKSNSSLKKNHWKSSTSEFEYWLKIITERALRYAYRLLLHCYCVVARSRFVASIKIGVSEKNRSVLNYVVVCSFFWTFQNQNSTPGIVFLSCTLLFSLGTKLTPNKKWLIIKRLPLIP